MENKLEVLDVLEEIQEPIVLEIDDPEDKKKAHEAIIQIENIGIESEELLERRKKAQEKRQKNKNEESYRQLLRFKDMKTILWSEVESVELDEKHNMIGIIAYWN